MCFLLATAMGTVRNPRTTFAVKEMLRNGRVMRSRLNRARKEFIPLQPALIRKLASGRCTRVPWCTAGTPIQFKILVAATVTNTSRSEVIRRGSLALADAVLLLNGAFQESDGSAEGNGEENMPPAQSRKRTLREW